MSDKLRFGEILVRAGVIKRELVEKAAHHWRSSDRNLGELLVQHKLIDETVMLQALGRALNLPCVSLDSIEPDERALSLLTATVCMKYLVFPIEVERTRAGDHLHLAMANPADIDAIRTLTRIARHRIRPMVTSAREIRIAIKRFFDPNRRPTGDRVSRTSGEFRAARPTADYASVAKQMTGEFQAIRGMTGEFAVPRAQTGEYAVPRRNTDDRQGSTRRATGEHAVVRRRPTGEHQAVRRDTGEHPATARPTGEYKVPHVADNEPVFTGSAGESLATVGAPVARSSTPGRPIPVVVTAKPSRPRAEPLVAPPTSTQTADSDAEQLFDFGVVDLSAYDHDAASNVSADISEIEPVAERSIAAEPRVRIAVPIPIPSPETSTNMTMGLPTIVGAPIPFTPADPAPATLALIEPTAPPSSTITADEYLPGEPSLDLPAVEMSVATADTTAEALDQIITAADPPGESEVDARVRRVAQAFHAACADNSRGVPHAVAAVLRVLVRRGVLDADEIVGALDD